MTLSIELLRLHLICTTNLIQTEITFACFICLERSRKLIFEIKIRVEVRENKTNW